MAWRHGWRVHIDRISEDRDPNPDDRRRGLLNPLVGGLAVIAITMTALVYFKPAPPAVTTAAETVSAPSMPSAVPSAVPSSIPTVKITGKWAMTCVLPTAKPSNPSVELVKVP